MNEADCDIYLQWLLTIRNGSINISYKPHTGKYKAGLNYYMLLLFLMSERWQKAELRVLTVFKHGYGYSYGWLHYSLQARGSSNVSTCRQVAHKEICVSFIPTSIPVQPSSKTVPTGSLKSIKYTHLQLNRHAADVWNSVQRCFPLTDIWSYKGP